MEALIIDLIYDRYCILHFTYIFNIFVYQINTVTVCIILYYMLNVFCVVILHTVCKKSSKSNVELAKCLQHVAWSVMSIGMSLQLLS